MNLLMQGTSLIMLVRCSIAGVVLSIFCACAPTTVSTASLVAVPTLSQFCGALQPLTARSRETFTENVDKGATLLNSSKVDPYLSEFYVPNNTFVSTVQFPNEEARTVFFRPNCQPQFIDEENLEFWGHYQIEDGPLHPARIITNYFNTYIYFLGFPDLALYQKPSNINSAPAFFVSNDGGAYRGPFNEVLKAYQTKSYTGFGIVSRMASRSHKLLYRDIPKYVWDGNNNDYSSGSYSSSSSSGGCSGYCPVHVNGYFRANGTYVAPHNRSAPRK